MIATYRTISLHGIVSDERTITLTAPAEHLASTKLVQLAIAEQLGLGYLDVLVVSPR